MSAWQNVPPLPGGVPSTSAALLYGDNIAASLPPDLTSGISIGISSGMGGMVDDGATGGMMNGLHGLEMDINMSGMEGMDMDMDYGPQDGGQNSGLQQAQQNVGMQQQQQQGPSSLGREDSNSTSYSQPVQQEVVMAGAGAGPLPTGFGMSAPPNSSTLTEFTKRRNWSQRIIEELKDFLHILTPDGRILYVSPSCKSITGYEPQQLIGRFIAEFVHPDDSGIFMREFNESIASGNSLRFFYRFKKDDGTYMIFECDGHPHISHEPQQMAQESGMAAAGMCRGFFMMARPYPTKNAALLDSFLEHKIENERLMRRIEELKKEELEENAEQDRLYREHAIASASHTGATSESNSRAQGAAGVEASSDSTANPDYQGMPPPAKPSISNTALTRQNLDSALSAQKPDSIADKMSRYEASGTHLESIELLTGLRYRDGERSHGISTGDTSPALIRGDAGIAILVDRDRDGPKKDKKKMKVADEYVCADCGTLDSPEWRKGPRGPKTLCNACGLRWAKKEKKEMKKGTDGSDTPTQQSPVGPGPGGSGYQGVGGMAGAGLPQPPSLPMQTSTGSSG